MPPKSSVSSLTVNPTKLNGPISVQQAPQKTELVPEQKVIVPVQKPLEEVNINPFNSKSPYFIKPPTSEQGKANNRAKNANQGKNMSLENISSATKSGPDYLQILPKGPEYATASEVRKTANAKESQVPPVPPKTGFSKESNDILYL